MAAMFVCRLRFRTKCLLLGYTNLVFMASVAEVTFNMSAKPSRKGYPTPFPKLGKLDMSGNPLNMDVWDFLHPLANNYYLSVVIASGCNLTGEVA